ncbi:MAG TPA: 4Fe-4S dicluster domain-containing protein, partial [Chloroflexota bacterium]|nr:4Fe-4S dicluster domain-containing protein [Chloroflexota bacterium]
QGGLSRRRFLELMGASAALAGVAGCSAPPRDRIVPYVRPPEEVVPGKPLYFTTAHLLGGYARGVLAESHEGRPTKIEGNPDHPASLGGTDVFAQASILTLYDPARARSVTNEGRIRTWADVLRSIQSAVSNLRPQQGAGLRILTETTTSPTLINQLQSVTQTLPQARWHEFDPVGRDNERAGAQLAFGASVTPRYRFDQAEVILGLEPDFLSFSPGSLRYIREFAARRRVRAEQPSMHRLYVMESALTLEGALADHRLALAPTSLQAQVEALAGMLGVGGAAPPSQDLLQSPWLSAVAADLQQHRGTGLVVPGEGQPARVHALAHAINQTLGNIGRTLELSDPVASFPSDPSATLPALVEDMQAGQVQLLLTLGGNPVYSAPADLGFAEALESVPLSVYHGLFENETAGRCRWHVPAAHELETWGDARAYDGTVTIMQPLIAPLYQGRSAHELLAALSDQPERSAHDIVKSYWSSQHSGADFESFWQMTLRDGFIANSTIPARAVSVQSLTAATPAQATNAGGGSLEIVFRPDPTIFDGSYAHNGWLQELPKPLTKLTWDNAACISPGTAERLDLTNGDVVELQYQGRTVDAPIWIQNGQADSTVYVTLGYGRVRGAGAANGNGFNAYALRTSDAPWSATGVLLRKTGGRQELANTQGHYQMEGRDLVRTTTLEEFRRDPSLLKRGSQDEGELSLFPEYPYPGHAWGMVIDLNACVGCNACVTACQAENNIPVVGKREVLREREMHWIRVDRYYQTENDELRVLHQPVPCMHCEHAPCELVCPVAATVHSSDGLNDMVYNRCVGTRYCSNNCPYKVRRFNFFEFADFQTESLKMLHNPDVTVRSRGVMEKCTYCVQRIRGAEIQARKEGRPIRDGEILTACQAACPADAIIFGDINDPNSQIAQLKAQPHNYGLLDELNTRPRTTYLGMVRNPNPALRSAQP